MTVTVPGGTLRLNRRRVTALSWPAGGEPLGALGVTERREFFKFPAYRFYNIIDVYLLWQVTASDFAVIAPDSYVKFEYDKDGTYTDNTTFAGLTLKTVSASTTISAFGLAIHGYSSPVGYSHFEMVYPLAGPNEDITYRDRHSDADFPTEMRIYDKNDALKYQVSGLNFYGRDTFSATQPEQFFDSWECGVPAAQQGT